MHMIVALNLDDMYGIEYGQVRWVPHIDAYLAAHQHPMIKPFFGELGTAYYRQQLIAMS